MNRQFYLIFTYYCVMQSRSHAKYYFLRIGAGSLDGVRDFNADLWKNIETTSVCSIDSNVVVFFIWGRGGSFLGGGSFKGET